MLATRVAFFCMSGSWQEVSLRRESERERLSAEVVAVSWVSGSRSCGWAASGTSAAPSVKFRPRETLKIPPLPAPDSKFSSLLHEFQDVIDSMITLTEHGCAQEPPIVAGNSLKEVFMTCLYNIITYLRYRPPNLSNLLISEPHTQSTRGS